MSDPVPFHSETTWFRDIPLVETGVLFSDTEDIEVETVTGTITLAGCGTPAGLQVLSSAVGISSITPA